MVKISCFRVCPLAVTNSLKNRPLTEGRSTRDKTSSFSNFFSADTISFGSMFWHSLIYSSLKTEPNESDNMSMLDDVRREHWLRLIDSIAGAAEISARRPTSESRYAPFKDKNDSIGKFFGDLAKVDGIT